MAPEPGVAAWPGDIERLVWMSPRTAAQLRHWSVLRAQGAELLHLDIADDAAARLRTLHHDAIVVEPPPADLLRAATCLARLRAASSAPLVVLGRPADESRQALYYDIGVDEQLDPGVGSAVLVSCLRSLVLRHRRAFASHGGVAAEAGALRVDCAGRFATWRGQSLALTPTERVLLFELALRAGAVAARADLQRAVPRRQPWHHARTLDVRVSRLRRALQAQTGGAVAIEAVTGVGYRLQCLGPGEYDAEEEVAASPWGPSVSFLRDPMPIAASHAAQSCVTTSDDAAP